MFSISGVVKKIGEIQEITETFKKRELVVTEQSGPYPQDILFELTQDNTNMVEGISENDLVTVNFNIRGREWTSPQGEVKYFNSLNAWRLQKGMANQNQQQFGGATQQPAQNQEAKPRTADDAETLMDESDDDLPF